MLQQLHTRGVGRCVFSRREDTCYFMLGPRLRIATAVVGTDVKSIFATSVLSFQVEEKGTLPSFVGSVNGDCCANEASRALSGKLEDSFQASLLQGTTWEPLCTHVDKGPSTRL